MIHLLEVHLKPEVQQTDVLIDKLATTSYLRKIKGTELLKELNNSTVRHIKNLSYQKYSTVCVLGRS